MLIWRAQLGRAVAIPVHRRIVTERFGEDGDTPGSQHPTQLLHRFRDIEVMDDAATHHYIDAGISQVHVLGIIDMEIHVRQIPVCRDPFGLLNRHIGDIDASDLPRHMAQIERHDLIAAAVLEYGACTTRCRDTRAKLLEAVRDGIVEAARTSLPLGVIREPLVVEITFSGDALCCLH